MPSNRQSEARARVALDPKPFEKGAKAVIDAANKMSAAITAAFAAAGVAMLAAFGADTISNVVKSVKEVISFGEQMANAGKKAGLAAGQFYLFNSAVEKGIGLKTAAALLGENAGALNRSAEVFRDVSIKLWAIGEKIRGFWLGLMERVAPVLSRILDGTLGLQLVTAGQMFGEQIAKAIAIVYQLAKDGKLWSSFKDGFKLAFDYAGERMIWLARISFKILKEVFSKAFVEGLWNGLKAVWDAVVEFCADFGEQLGNAFWDLWTEIKDAWYGLLNTIGDWLVWLGLKDEQQHVTDQNDRAQEIRIMRQVGASNGKEPEGEDFLERLVSIFKENQFEPSEGLQKQIDDFGNMLNETFAKYNKEEAASPTKQFENNTRRVTTGVDSLAAIGAGGGVYLGLSVLDVQRSQLRELQQINQKLSARPVPVTNNFSLPATDPSGISRAQVAPPLAPSR